MDQEIIFLDEDTPVTTAIKTVYLWCGSNQLPIALKKLGITYTKGNKGVHVEYYLKGDAIGKLTVRL